MATFNKVTLLGNITRDIELKSIAGGQSVAKIGLALNRSFTTSSGEKRDEVTYVDCEAWGKQAEVMAKYLAKGRPVLIEGRLKLDSWEDKEGKKQSKLKVVVEEFVFVDSRQGGGGGGGGGHDDAGESSGGGGGGGWSKPAPKAAPRGGAPATAEPADDIPF
ncbi:MAG: single-stranded DNA-binding protein [Tepidisphaera sp.]|nr:single-stranded DNA-binding protein [Tepidisphaera sp.]